MLFIYLGFFLLKMENRSIFTFLTSTVEGCVQLQESVMETPFSPRKAPHFVQPDEVSITRAPHFGQVIKPMSGLLSILTNPKGKTV